VSDVIHLSGLEVFAHHGVFEHERQNGQLFVLDVDVEIDSTRAAASDDLGDTVNYAALAQAISDSVAGEPVNLLETLALRVLTTIFGFEHALSAHVTIHKPQAPMPVTLAGVSFTMFRERSQVVQ
jgi:dihydroneopterin aldolase